MKWHGRGMGREEERRQKKGHTRCAQQLRYDSTCSLELNFALTLTLAVAEPPPPPPGSCYQKFRKVRKVSKTTHSATEKTSNRRER